MGADLASTIADLTTFRDREQLDVTLAGALRDLLRARQVAVWTQVSVADELRWHRRAEIGFDDLAAWSDPAWMDPHSLPTLASAPLRAHCWQEQRPVFAEGPPALSLFPLLGGQGVSAVLEIRSEAPLATEGCRLVGSLLRIYQNFQALLDDSERDTLTGLLNRKTFDERFLRLSAGQGGEGASTVEPDGRRSVTGPRGVYLGVIDIDHFKQVNDRYGHLIGDEVLLMMSRLMRSTFRYGDRLYRFGGEEFVVVMQCGGAQAALQAFERLRQNVQQFVFPQVRHITVSVGFTEVVASDSPGAAFGRADRAVYFAKAEGRNQVHDHATLLAHGRIVDAARTGDVELF